MDVFIVSLMAGLLANAIWFLAERILESVWTRENPPSNDDEA